MERKDQNTNGFSLIELMFVIAILAILGGIATPAVGRMVRGYRIGADVRDLQSAVQQARIQAVKRSIPVGISFDFANDQYTTFVDSGDTQLEVDTNDTVLSTGSMSTGVDLYGKAFDKASPVIRFSSRGALEWPTSTERIELKSSDEEYRGVSIRITGTSTIVRSGDGNTWL